MLYNNHGFWRQEALNSQRKKAKRMRSNHMNNIELKMLVERFQHNARFKK